MRVSTWLFIPLLAVACNTSNEPSPQPASGLRPRPTAIARPIAATRRRARGSRGAAGAVRARHRRDAWTRPGYTYLRAQDRAEGDVWRQPSPRPP